MKLEKRIEILAHQLRGIWYEIHVDSTEQREIFNVFAESGEVTDEIRTELQAEVDKINNI
jgi:hypothetical protein